MTRPSTIQLGYLVRFGLVAVEGAELAASIAEEYQEVLRLRARNLLQHFLFGLAVNNAGKNTVFNGIQDDSTIRFGRWLFIEFRTCGCSVDKVRHIRIFSDISFYFFVGNVKLLDSRSQNLLVHLSKCRKRARINAKRW